ncbi:unnamed protein product [Didymodactylos carnosus]|uniref:AIG1-type G domain-containing protein n=1 Tax=Didymodactylos carnosus TaxID=1234261 RepID=A0A814JZT0_9BILA|nr:unnamed protein product [Didymodactylos carnosus]CAF1228710.1 unnamed protein product [Didymodactylos carnosus]CAF3814729.1 unnamed protein product [Didymodactylos carnosus]CAF4036695.1 unnamed protein product [Didymodactylos carnosus]
MMDRYSMPTAVTKLNDRDNDTLEKKPFKHSDWYNEGEQQTQSDIMRIICLGRTGAGKSSLGNTLLGQKWFKSKQSTKSVTEKCAVGNRLFKGIQMSVVDTPGLFDNKLSQSECHKEIARCIQTVVPGPHAFLIVIRCDTRFTPEEKACIIWIKEKFGEKALDYCIVVMTHLDSVEKDDQTIEQFIKDGDEEIKELITKCGGRYCAVNNDASAEEKDIVLIKLLQIISIMIKANDGKVFTNEMIRRLTKALRRNKEAHGEYKMIEPDGTINPLPEVEEEVAEYYQNHH